MVQYLSFALEHRAVLQLTWQSCSFQFATGEQGNGKAVEKDGTKRFEETVLMNGSVHYGHWSVMWEATVGFRKSIYCWEFNSKLVYSIERSR